MRRNHHLKSPLPQSKNTVKTSAARQKQTSAEQKTLGKPQKHNTAHAAVKAGNLRINATRDKTIMPKRQEISSPADTVFNFPHYKGAAPEQTVPLILETLPTPDYALIDSGFGRKLERYGAYRIIRPEAQALWPPHLSEQYWANADAVFTGNLEEEGVGRWRFPQAELQSGAGAVLPETWALRRHGLPFLGRFTSFRHVGVFPEQEAHWRFMEHAIRQALSEGRKPKVLNLFGYTGVASLIAARAGADVVHVDASKKAIGWTLENQFFADMESAPIRRICEDALKFMKREEKREQAYDIILLDPPAFGRGPKGEIWQFFTHCAELLARARALLSPQPLAIILTAYSIRASFYALHGLMTEIFRGYGGRVESGELLLREEAGGRALSTSLFSRWVADRVPPLAAERENVK